MLNESVACNTSVVWESSDPDTIYNIQYRCNTSVAWESSDPEIKEPRKQEHHFVTISSHMSDAGVGGLGVLLDA